ncbi:MAG: hypothetical protein CVV44_03840 [Spirochaetae bacterium HGW-Spirochaetae-1]|nr:MAG: hypothetical protein CVV44_03840 [Spirochaetae bacterium HGW-Spirochaetae-1]
MTYKRRDLFFWYEICERQVTEEDIITKFRKENKEIPDPEKLRGLVDEEIQKRRERLNSG